MIAVGFAEIIEVACGYGVNVATDKVRLILPCCENIIREGK
jgi:hypothetical protein